MVFCNVNEMLTRGGFVVEEAEMEAVRTALVVIGGGSVEGGAVPFVLLGFIPCEDVDFIVGIALFEYIDVFHRNARSPINTCPIDIPLLGGGAEGVLGILSSSLGVIDFGVEMMNK